MDISEHNSTEKRKVWVEDGKVRYTSLPTKYQGIMKVCSNRFMTQPGNVMIDNQVVSYFERNEGISYIKQMLLFGYSTFIQRISIDYESETDQILSYTRQMLNPSPIDYALAVSIPLSRVTESWLRKLKQQSISFVVFEISSVEEMKETPWQRLIEAMFPKRILCIGEPSRTIESEKEKKEIYDSWLQVVETFRINSYLSVPNNWTPLPPLLLMRLGLYPQKGVLIMGSDADYMMYSLNGEKKPFDFPEIIVNKGKVIKAGQRWEIKEGSGEELTNLIPEKMIPINDVFRYSDQSL